VISGRTGRVLIALLGLICASAVADEFKPAYLQLQQIDATTYDVLWKLPALDERRTLAVRPEFPVGTTDLTARRSTFSNGTAVLRWKLRVPHGLEGHAIEFAGLETARIDVLVRVVRQDGTTQLARLTPVEHQFVVRASPRALEVARTYTAIGIEHILLGFDHLLFVLSLLLLVDGVRRLLWTVTAFTLAHSITLAAASLGVLHVPGPPAEACIALSVVFVAGEIVHGRRGRPGLTQRSPWVVAFTFGLLHGLGFAGALAQVGLPEKQIPTALLFFNVGVEIGQVLFILAVLSLISVGRLLASRVRMTWPAWGALVAPYAIGGVASYWLFERIAAL
jgi:hydrogenase/urease accessory protein HupE